MKILIFFLVLLTYTLCQSPFAQAIPAEEAFKEIKKAILECISKEETATPELKQYANENLNSDMKERLDFTKYRENESDKKIIRDCRRKAFIVTNKARHPMK